MAEMIFPCPSCQQNISCDDSFAGQQLQCPLCQAVVTMPARQPASGKPHSPLAPKPPPPGAGSLSIGSSRVESAGHNAQRSIPIRKVELVKKEKSSFVKTYGPIAAGLAILGAVVYFGWPYVRKWQDESNAKSRAEEKNADGGQVGHIADLNSVLDATEPGGAGLASLAKDPSGGPAAKRTAERAIKVAEGADPGSVAADGSEPKPEKALPIVPPIHTLEVDQGKIAESQVNGMISGTNFVAQTIRLDPGAGFQMLRFIEGSPASPEREISIYLRPKAGDTPTNRSWTVTKDLRSGVPTVTKRWKTNPKYAPQSRPFNSGYALKLELKQDEEGTTRGSIFLALPDTEQSVIAGKFKITGVAADAFAAPVVVPTAAPVPGMNPADKAAFDRRYGVPSRR